MQFRLVHQFARARIAIYGGTSSFLLGGSNDAALDFSAALAALDGSGMSMADGSRSALRRRACDIGNDLVLHRQRRLDGHVIRMGGIVAEVEIIQAAAKPRLGANRQAAPPRPHRG